MSEHNHYKHLASEPDSFYKRLLHQPIRAESLYLESLEPDGLTPEEIAREYEVPLDAVREAIDYCMRNQGRLEQDRQRALTGWASTGAPRLPQTSTYRYLAPKQGSSYRQCYVDQRMRAETLYRDVIGPNRRTPEEVADNWNIPLEAVYEAIHYCQHNKQLLDSERAREQAWIKATGHDRWPYAPRDFQPAE